MSHYSPDDAQNVDHTREQSASIAAMIHGIRAIQGRVLNLLRYVAASKRILVALRLNKGVVGWCAWLGEFSEQTDSFSISILDADDMHWCMQGLGDTTNTPGHELASELCRWVTMAFFFHLH